MWCVKRGTQMENLKIDGCGERVLRHEHMLNSHETRLTKSNHW